MTNTKHPFADTALVKYLSKKLDESPKTQRQIAEELGYDRPNIVSMFKLGQAPFPIAKIPLLAKALDADVGLLMRMALQQSNPSLGKAINEVFGDVFSANEREIIHYIRGLSNETNPPMSDELRGVLQAYFESHQAEIDALHLLRTGVEKGSDKVELKISPLEPRKTRKARQ